MRSAARRLALLALCTCGFLLLSLPTEAAPPLGAPEYIVKAGDTLFSIATRYHTTVAALKQLNGLKGDSIQVGQKLVLPSTANSAAPSAPAVPAATAVPAAPPVSYLVQPGDSLYRIALQFGTTARAIEDLNGIPNSNLISPGQALAIPGNSALVKPGLTIDPPQAKQGGTLLVKVARAGLESISGTYGTQKISFARGAGYFYGLVGISRCAKAGNAALRLTARNSSGQTSAESETFNTVATTFPIQTLTFTPGVAALLDSKLIQREEAQLGALVAPYTPTRLWNGAFRQPLTGIVSSYYGTRRSYNGGAVGACGHEGMDIAVAAGTPISSDARGRVVFAGLTQVRGNMVVVDHGLGVYSAYYHQTAVDVKVGQMVNAGDLIGKVGSTGLSTGAHLHWSLFVNGEYVDPLEWTRRAIPTAQ